MRSRIKVAERHLLPRVPAKQRRRWLYVTRQRRWPSFRRPSTFTEKVNWRILNDRRELLSWTCDKFQMKEHATQSGAPLVVPASLWSGRDVRELAHVQLPDRWVLKPSHRSGLVYFGDKGTDLEALAAATSTWCDAHEGEFLAEWAYLRAEPKLFVEEFVGAVDSAPPDYKFFVFGGEPRLIQVDLDRFGGHRRSFFTPEWKLVHVALNKRPSAGDLPAPAVLPQMLEAARILGRDFDFIRIDLYLDGDDVVFGEYTPYPGSGLTRWDPRQFDTDLGALWRIPTLTSAER